MTISAVLDACVLYSAPLRDFLLWLAYDKAFFPYWTGEIHTEWIRNLLEKRPDLEGKLERTRQEMDFRFPKSHVRGYESITPPLQLPAPKDWHVIAAAIHAKAKYIVTFDLKHFPKTVLQSHNIEAVSPDEFVQRLMPTELPLIIDAARHNRMSLKNPPKTVEQYLETLEEQKLFKTVEFLREHKDKI